MDVASIVISAVIALAGIVVALLIARRQIDSVSVDYEIDSDVSLWEADEDDVMASRIQIRYEDRELRHPRFIDVTVTNTGTKPVRAEDYDRPIVFQLEDNIAPVDARITEQTPDDIVENIFETQPNGVPAIAIRPRLLNPGDNFKLRMLFNHNDAKLEASHRIIGGKPMRQYSRDQLRTQVRITTRPLIVTYLVGFVIGAVILVNLTKNSLEAGEQVTSPTFALISSALLGGVGVATVAAVLVLIISAIYMKYFYR